MFKLLGLGLTLVSLSTFAGGHDGGGGRGVVCYNDKNEITSVELLDFYEGRTLEGLTITDYKGSPVEIYKEVILKADEDQQSLLEEGANLMKAFKFMPKGERLKPIDDSKEIFIPANCKVEQVANFQGINRIFIVSDFWEKLSETGKAGLLMHEYLWLLERESGVEKSIRARRSVARFFASNYSFEKRNLDVQVGDILCASHKKDIPVNAFVVKKSADQSCTANFSILNGAPVYTKQTMELSDCASWDFSRAMGPVKDTPAILDLASSFVVKDAQDDLFTHVVRLLLGTTKDELGFYHTNFDIQVQNKEFSGFDDETKSELECHPATEEDLNDPWWI